MTPVAALERRCASRVIPSGGDTFRKSEGPKGAGICMALSLLAHAALGAGLYWSFYGGRETTIVAELDLTLSPLSAFGRAGGGGKPSEAWFLPPKGKKAPLPPPPAARAAAPVTVEEVKAEEASACFGDNCTGEGTGSGAGVGEGDGVMDAADAAQKPRWIRNMISSSDYPRVARQSGKDGLVVLQVLLDERGRVRDARLLQGPYEALNEVALRKVRGAVFTPARDAAGRPAACRMTLPIRFELR